jgi:hypothetical protein
MLCFCLQYICGFFSNTHKLRSPYLYFISFKPSECHETWFQENLHGAVSLEQQKHKINLPHNTVMGAEHAVYQSDRIVKSQTRTGC